MKYFSVVALCALVLTGCATPYVPPKLAAPQSLTAPKPIIGNSGSFMSPYTEDGTVAPWVEKGRSAKAGGQIGGFIGAQAGQKLAENIPFFGSMIGQRVGEKAGRSVALQMVGGEDFIKQNSDISFNNINDLAVYMYVKNSTHKDYAEVLTLTQQIYPELAQGYFTAISNASSGK
jgi:hypothetical protein